MQIRKFNITVKKKKEIQKLYLSFKIRLKGKPKFEIYLLFFKKLEIGDKIHCLWVI